MFTPSGTWILISCLSALSSASKSISLLWTRISHLSQVSEPSPSGDFLQGTTRRFVGNGIGPLMATPVLSEICFICLQTPSTFCGSVPLNDMRALCDAMQVHQNKNEEIKRVYISFFSTSMTVPAATVWPMSLTANRPSCGKSFAVSMTIGLVGTTLT